MDLLTIYYTNFDKAYIAALCKKVAEGANEGDQLCLHIFNEAGTHLARALSSVIPKASKELTEREGGTHILCVGSVWLSWHLLKSGFVFYIQNNTNIEKFSLMKLKTTSAVGAAYMAADKHKFHLPRDYTKNYEVFYTYKHDENVSCKNAKLYNNCATN